MSENNSNNTKNEAKQISKAGVIRSEISEQAHVSPEEQMKERYNAMTWREKLDYLWTYYKWIPITIVVGIFVAVVLFSSMGGSGLEQMAYGAAINNAATDSQLSAMMKDATAAAGGDISKEEILIEGQLAIDTGDESDLQMDGSYEMACMTKIGVAIYSGDLDFIIGPPATVKVYMENGVLDDMSKYIDTDSMGDRVIRTEDGMAYAIILRKEDMNEAYADMFDGFCFSILGNSEKTQISADVLRMLIGEDEIY